MFRSLTLTSPSSPESCPSFATCPLEFSASWSKITGSKQSPWFLGPLVSIWEGNNYIPNHSEWKLRKHPNFSPFLPYYITLKKQILETLSKHILGESGWSFVFSKNITLGQAIIISCLDPCIVPSCLSLYFYFCSSTNHSFAQWPEVLSLDFGSPFSLQISVTPTERTLITRLKKYLPDALALRTLTLTFVSLIPWHFIFLCTSSDIILSLVQMLPEGKVHQILHCSPHSGTVPGIIVRAK